ncbi:MAG: cytochrome c biogenesis protein CcsA [Gemmatimonadetes bacterium]|nr:cytochrome c biogenesis protein CcsA [Gemmatimonadota bacterium]NNM05939.1 cytochrome c biogenesis protein CcsA [Gemmatimonadota bacterium]
MSPKIRWSGAVLGVLGLALVLVMHWQVFFWVSTERTMGVVQRIFYIHVPSAWVAFMAFGIVAVCSAVYLWLKDERLDMAAVAAAEGGIIFTVIVLITGPLWGKIAWGTWWEWEPRLTLTLLLFFIYVGYFLVRSSTENPERAKRFAAVVGIVGALDIPLIHVSVQFFRSLHPEPVVMRPDGPSLPGDMLTTLFTGLGALTVLFLAFFLFRYGLERMKRALDHRQLAGEGIVLPEGAKS